MRKSTIEQMRLECSSECWMIVNVYNYDRKLFHTSGPQTENARFPNMVRVRRTTAGLVVDLSSFTENQLWNCTHHTPQSVSLHGTSYHTVAR